MTKKTRQTTPRPEKTHDERPSAPLPKKGLGVKTRVKGGSGARYDIYRGGES